MPRNPSDIIPRQWQEEAREAFLNKLLAHDENLGQFSFLLAAGVGSGKTIYAAMIASHLLNSGTVSRIIYVCPNLIIKQEVRRQFERFGIFLVDWSNKKYPHGEPADSDGGVVTYHSLLKMQAKHRELCRKSTLVIFDEIHHLGDVEAWGKAATEAFGGCAAVVLGMSGTPYRADGCEMPFVQYEQSNNCLKRFKLDYPYRLGRAIADQVCRKPVFRWYTGKIKITTGEEEQVLQFGDEASEDTANLMLSGFVKPGSASRQEYLRYVIEDCKKYSRKLIIFVGGDTTSDVLATDDANSWLPQELEACGLTADDYRTVTSKDRNAAKTIKTFGESSASVLVTVNMVSEGVDIPELSAALFLTSVTAKGTTIQRIGRVLRGRGDAMIYMASDPRYRELAKEIEQEYDQEILIKKKRERRESNSLSSSFATPTIAEGLSASPDGITIGSTEYSQERYDAAVSLLEEHGIPITSERVNGLLLAMGLVGVA